MIIKNIISKINIVSHCREEGVGLWQCPQFLFIVMGAIEILSAISAFVIGTRYIDDPQAVSIIVLILTSFLFVLGFFITQSFERLAEANRMKSEFVNIVSHQLRTPLSNLKWVIELLMSGKMGKVEPDQVEYFRILKNNNDRMRDLISDLLIVSRIERKNLSMKEKETSLETLIKNLVSEFNAFVRASNIEVSIEAQKDLPKIMCDPIQIRLVLENFFDNAVRYSGEKGKIKIRIEARNKEIYFEVEDKGVGIPKKDQKYIFQKFFRSENVLRLQTQGTGLGLFIAKSIIERSNGRIGFESKENKGSKFWFTLPIK